MSHVIIKSISYCGEVLLPVDWNVDLSLFQFVLHSHTYQNVSLNTLIERSEFSQYTQLRQLIHSTIATNIHDLHKHAVYIGVVKQCKACSVGDFGTVIHCYSCVSEWSR